MPSDWQERITPDFVSTLQDNEIFVFGCRNSGRHWDGASAFALKHFGAVFGQRGRSTRAVLRHPHNRRYHRVASNRGICHEVHGICRRPSRAALPCNGDWLWRGRLASVTDRPDVPQGGIAAECMASTGFLGFPLCVIDQEEILFLWAKQ